MATTENNWSLGEKVTLRRQERLLKGSDSKSYLRYIGSRYICIREATDGQRGILMKVLGKASSDKIMMVNGEPFGKDDRDEQFFGIRYLSYTFPTSSQVMEALDILRDNLGLLTKFEYASMHVNPKSSFWVSDTSRNMLLQKKPQVLSGRDGQLHPSRDNIEYYRVTFVYFDKDSLEW